MNLRSTASSSLRAAGAAPPEAFWLPSWHAFIKTVELGSMDFAATEGLITKLMGKGEAGSRRELMELHGDSVEIDV